MKCECGCNRFYTVNYLFYLVPSKELIVCCERCAKRYALKTTGIIRIVDVDANIKQNDQ